MKVSKEKRRRILAERKMSCIVDGKLKPSKKAVEEFHRPVYGFGKKGEEDEKERAHENHE